MGNNNSQEQTKLAQLYSQYQPQKTRDEQFGDCTVLISKSNSKEKLLLKEYTYTDEQIYKKSKKEFEIKQQSQNQYILKIIDIYSTSDQQVCSQFFKTYLLIEHPKQLLYSTTINPQDYWAILFGYVRALEELQQKQIPHEHINTKTLYLPPKICYPQLYEQSTNYQLLFQNNRLTEYYLSPQQAMGLRQKEFQPSHNPYKSDVFILGMCLLEAILKSNMNECYKQLYLVEEILLQKIHQLSLLVQPQFSEILMFMLQIQENQRPDFIQLSKFVDIKYQESLQVTFKYQLTQFHSYQQQQQSQITQEQQLLQSNQQNQQNQQLPAMKQIKSSKSNVKKPTLREIITEPSNTDSIVSNYIQEKSIQLSQPIQSSKPDLADEIEQVYYSDIISKPSKQDENLDPHDLDDQYTNRSLNLPLQDQTEQHLNQNLLLKLSNINTKESQQQFSLPYDLPQNQPHLSGFSSQGEIFVNEQYQDGSKFQGYKFNGMRHGQGIFHYKDGGYYDGNWQFNHMHGYGTLYYSNGNPAYKGSWNQDKFQGYGILYNEIPAQFNDPFNYQDFDHIEDYWVKYEGEFNDDNKEGQGTLYLSNGEKFCGQFLKDYVNGFGLFHSKNNKIIEGRWQNNKLIK